MIASVIIAVRGDSRIYRLLDSLEDQTYCRSQFEVIVVENGTAMFADVAARSALRVRYVHLAIANMAAARNAGLAVASGKFVLSTDADVVTSPTWIERMVGALENRPFAAVGGEIRKFNPQTVVQKHAITIVDGQTSLSYLPALHFPYVAGANCAYLASAIKTIGGFDIDLPSGNDVDICYRLGIQGWRVGLARDAVVYHEDRTGIAQHFARFRRYAIYQVCLFRKYKHLSGRGYVLNPYPARRLLGAIGMLPKACLRALKGDGSLLIQAALQTIEAVGIWLGSLEGAIRYRQLYI